MTKLDVMVGMDELKVCTAYRLPDGRLTDRFPTDPAALDAVEPVYETLPGFADDLGDAADRAGLPAAARDYLAFMEERLGVPISVVGTGPKREETLVA